MDTARAAGLLRRVSEAVQNPPIHPDDPEWEAKDGAFWQALEREHASLTPEEKVWFSDHHWADGRIVTQAEVIAQWDAED